MLQFISKYSVTLLVLNEILKKKLLSIFKIHTSN